VLLVWNDGFSRRTISNYYLSFHEVADLHTPHAALKRAAKLAGLVRIESQWTARAETGGYLSDGTVASSQGTHPPSRNLGGAPSRVKMDAIVRATCHLPAYFDEMTWPFNNRKNPFLFRDTMLKLIASDNLEYKELTKAA